MSMHISFNSLSSIVYIEYNSLGMDIITFFVVSMYIHWLTSYLANPGSWRSGGGRGRRGRAPVNREGREDGRGCPVPSSAGSKKQQLPTSIPSPLLHWPHHTALVEQIAEAPGECNVNGWICRHQSRQHKERSCGRIGWGANRRGKILLNIAELGVKVVIAIVAGFIICWKFLGPIVLSSDNL